MEKVIKPGDRQAERVAKSSRYLETVLERVPVIVVPCHLGSPADMGALLGGLGYPHEITDNLMASGFYGSIWPAVWSFMLALRSRGLGSALTTMHLAMEREVGDLLDIPDMVTQIGLVPVAYFTGETFKPAARKPAQDVTYWNEWKNKSPD